MIVVEQERIEIDHCLNCAGIWFDSGELELLVSILKAGGSEISGDQLLTPHRAKTNEAARKCPVCGRKMEKVWQRRYPELTDAKRDALFRVRKNVSKAHGPDFETRILNAYKHKCIEFGVEFQPQRDKLIYG